jgi:hypothetical protein
MASAIGIHRLILSLISSWGVKTEASDKRVTEKFAKLHLDIGIDAMTSIGTQGE